MGAGGDGEKGGEGDEEGERDDTLRSMACSPAAKRSVASSVAPLPRASQAVASAARIAAADEPTGRLMTSGCGGPWASEATVQ